MKDWIEYAKWQNELEAVEDALTHVPLELSLGDLIRAQMAWEHEMIDTIYERELINADRWDWLK